jgi:hypothetical protein
MLNLVTGVDARSLIDRLYPPFLGICIETQKSPPLSDCTYNMLVKCTKTKPAIQDELSHESTTALVTLLFSTYTNYSIYIYSLLLRCLLYSCQVFLTKRLRTRWLISHILSLSQTFIETLDPSKRIIVMGNISQLLSLGQTFGKTIILSMFKVQTTRPFDCDI